MDLQQAKILLEKINALQRSINLNQGPVASIERDLMLSYIRQLYEVYLDNEPQQIEAVSKPKIVPTETKVALKPQEVESPKPTYTPPRVEEPKPPVVKEEPTMIVREVLPPPPVIPSHQPTYTPPTPNPTPPPPVAPPPIQRSTPSNNSKINALFDFKQSNDLSERLSARPVSDLTKAFAINDRLLYINELFGKDGDSFSESLKLLNKFERIEEAKSLLISLAEQYDWSKEERIEIAQGFVRTVRRRYA